MITLTTLPLSAVDIDYNDDQIILYDATFTQSFGIIEKDTFYKCINISFINGTIECFSSTTWLNCDIKVNFNVISV
jgi:hypothetical protein